MRGRRCRTTVQAAKAECKADRVKRQPNVERPNQLWVADFTYVATWSGFVYTAFIIDVFANRIYDNALAESIIGLYKAESIHRRRPWRSLDDVEYATLEWVDWFNNRRSLEPIGHVPPADFELAYNEQLASQAVGA